MKLASLLISLSLVAGSAPATAHAPLRAEPTRAINLAEVMPVEIVREAAEYCYSLPDLGVKVSSTEACPRARDVREAIVYAQEIFGMWPGDVEGVSLVYTPDPFWCGWTLAQGCTSWDTPGDVSYLEVTVSSIAAGYAAVTAHEFGHVIQVRAGVQADHEPKGRWTLVEQHRGF